MRRRPMRVRGHRRNVDATRNPPHPRSRGENDADHQACSFHLWGVAELRGKSLRERVEAMIAIARPDFRNAFRHSDETIEAVS